MANDLANLAETVLRYGIMSLRENAVMPRLVLQDFAKEDAAHMSVINMAVPRAKTTRNVSAGTEATYDDQDMDLHAITLDQWKYAAFRMSDKEQKEVMVDGMLPSNASEALKSLCNTVDSYIITQMRAKCPWVYGTVGTIPNGIDDLIGVRKILQQNAAPAQNRALVMSTAVEAELLALSQFSSVNVSGRLDGLVQGDMGVKFGMDLAADQNWDSITYTSGDKAGTILTDGAIAVGDTVINIDGGTAAKLLIAGDVVTFVGHSQQYMVQSYTGTVNSGTITVFPPVKAIVATNSVITPLWTASQAPTIHGMGFAPGFFGLVNRQLPPVQDGLGSIVVSDQDPITGLILRLEVTRAHKMTNWVWDMLYGGDVIQPNLGCQLQG